MPLEVFVPDKQRALQEPWLGKPLMCLLVFLKEEDSVRAIDRLNGQIDPQYGQAGFNVHQGWLRGSLNISNLYE